MYFLGDEVRIFSIDMRCQALLILYAVLNTIILTVTITKEGPYVMQSTPQHIHTLALPSRTEPCHAAMVSDLLNCADLLTSYAIL